MNTVSEYRRQDPPNHVKGTLNMADREKIRLMARLAMLEENSGKKIRKAENTSRIDRITNPVWRWGFLVTLLFFAAAAAIAAMNINMVMAAVADDQTKNLIMIVLIAWLSLLAVTVVTVSVLSAARARRIDAMRNQYRQMLMQLERINAMEERYTGRGRFSPEEDDLWEEPSSSKRRRRRSRQDGEGPDYSRMEVLEFEDDDYCYYVEAVPKRGGRRG